MGLSENGGNKLYVISINELILIVILSGRCRDGLNLLEMVRVRKACRKAMLRNDVDFP
jgi:hypothetical protein